MPTPPVLDSELDTRKYVLGSASLGNVAAPSVRLCMFTEDWPPVLGNGTRLPDRVKTRPFKPVLAKRLPVVDNGETALLSNTVRSPGKYVAGPLGRVSVDEVVGSGVGGNNVGNIVVGRGVGGDEVGGIVVGSGVGGDEVGSKVGSSVVGALGKFYERIESET